MQTSFIGFSPGNLQINRKLKRLQINDTEI